jgi:type IV pilus assembly protein PilO
MSLDLGLNDFDAQKVETWPLLIKVIACVLAFVVVIGASWVAVIEDEYNDYNASIAKVEQLKAEFKEKAKSAANLNAYKEQIAELETLLEAQLRQLPNSNEVANLLDDISFIAQDNGLNLVSIKWEAEVQQEIYTELPMSIYVTGTYEQLGSFSADMAALPRIVTIDNFTLAHADIKNGSDVSNSDVLEMKMLAKTFRYNAEQAKKASERRDRRNQRQGGR